MGVVNFHKILMSDPLHQPCIIVPCINYFNKSYMRICSKFWISETETLPDLEDCNAHDDFDDMLSAVLLQSPLHPVSRPVCV